MNQNHQPLFNWEQHVAVLDTEHQIKFGQSRGYSDEFFAWLVACKLVGLFNGEHIIFPVADKEGTVVGGHYRLPDGTWRYLPAGTRTAPFILGDIATAKIIYAFESQWDLLALVDRLRHYQQPLADTAFIATRGAGNARLPAGLCAPDAVVYAFGQNDAPGQKWLATIAAACGCKCLSVVTPPSHKDLNDWTRAGATRPEIEAAIAAAQPVVVTNEPDLRAGLENIVSLPPEEDEADDHEPAEFPVHLLPPAMAGIVQGVADCERTPASLPAACALGVASAAIGAGLEIASGPDRVTRANLFLIADAESGSGKSQVFREIANPFIAHQKQLHDAFKETTAPEILSEIGLLTREIKRLEVKAAKESAVSTDRERLLGELQYKNARLTELKQMSMSPCVICGDVTSEKLAVLIAANHETLFSASPEARQILQIVCGRYNSNDSSDEAIYLAGYSGDFLRVDRLSRDPVTLHRPCLTVLWLVQPDAMFRLFNIETLAQSGFLPRFLACRTRATPKKIVAGESQAVSYGVRTQWDGLIAGLLASYHVAEKSFCIQPLPEAKRLLDDFFNEIVDRREGDLSDLGQFASRYGEQGWRVSLVFHAVLHGQDAHNHPLAVKTAQDAIEIVKWFIDEQLALLAKGRQQAAIQAQDEVLELLDTTRERKGQNFVTARDVLRARIKATAEAANELLARMEADGLLVGQDIVPLRGGKITKIYRRVQNPVPE